jgi:HK97 family phage prohead protease
MKPTINDIERRAGFATSVRARAGSGLTIEGTAASYGVLSGDLGGFKEKIQPGAFDASLADPNSDVKCLLNHSPDQILGRQRNGTLKVQADSKGLQYRCALDAANSFHKDTHSAISRQDISECSFSFIVPPDGDSWDFSTTPPTRTLKNVTLLDVSPCVFPAYSAAGATQVSARALAAVKKSKSALPVSDTVADRIRRDRVAVLGDLIAADKRAHMDSYDVSSAREAMAIDAALKEHGYRLVSCDDEQCYAVPVAYDGDPEEEACVRWPYEIDDAGNVELDHDNRETFHGWVKEADAAARSRYFAILPERRRAFADAELKRRMQSAAGISTR